MKWISIEEEGLPKRRITGHGNYMTAECTKECIATDGEDVWSEEFDFEYGSFHKSITHYIIIEEIDPPNIG